MGTCFFDCYEKKAYSQSQWVVTNPFHLLQLFMTNNYGTNGPIWLKFCMRQYLHVARPLTNFWSSTRLFFAHRVKKKPGRASKICHRPSNVQILAHAKFQPNRTSGSLRKGCNKWKGFVTTHWDWLYDGWREVESDILFSADMHRYFHCKKYTYCGACGGAVVAYVWKK